MEVTTQDISAVLIGKARRHAQKLHGTLTSDTVRAAGILTEETGEVMKEALSLTRRPPVNGARRRLVMELAQLAATAEMMLEQYVTEQDLEA